MTHEDVPDVLYGGSVKDRRLFARDTVRFEGDIVAGVAALTPEIAREAAALVDVELEPLPVVTDFEAALDAGATLVHPDWESYEGDEELGRHDNVLGFSTIVKGDVDAALASADVVVKGRYVTDPVQGVPIEPRAIVAEWQRRPGDRVVVDAGAVRRARRGRRDARHSPSPGCASSSRSWAAASARSATSTSRVTSRRSRVPPAGP